MNAVYHVREPLVYALDNLLNDDDWAFLFSYSVEPPDADEGEERKACPRMRKEAQAGMVNDKLARIDRFEK